MTFTAHTRAGKSHVLPAPYAYRVGQSMGTPCGAISLSIGYDAAQGGVLRETETLSVRDDNGRIVFTGVLDGFETSQDGQGRDMTVRGRGMAARLMDNAAAPAGFAAAHWNDLVARYVTPLGMQADAVGLPCVTDFRVETGRSVWQALCDFTRACGGGLPYVKPDGVLSVARPGAAPKTRLTPDAGTPILFRRFGYDRYGVIAQIAVRNRDTGAATTLENSAYRDPLGRRQTLTGVGREGVAAMEAEARLRMAESMRGLLTGRLWLAGGFFAMAGDVLEIRDEAPPFAGLYVVWESETVCDGDGATTRLALIAQGAFR